jgi:NADH-quinone oxidoreductase subunit M
MPRQAMFFLFTGLASIGFPGTIGFVGAELLVEGAVEASPWVGTLVVITSAINGLAIMHAYFRVFTGTRHPGTVDLQARPAERAAVLMLTALILGGGLYPQPGISSRYHAAVELSKSRTTRPFKEREFPPPDSDTATGRSTHPLPTAATPSRVSQVAGEAPQIQRISHLVD